ncbi:hypothetical protein HJG54_19685 [Leptolyngbya sp. NK1-12]|uniref:Uncharacterized protein n=1 Tax=Leptolyngbya sp. NK1-12 TaxID=2547451 RepID=A0AA96WGW7_9CYAN|nr:hypothetical protein [Leptolyngbya sp. NK1-12]WNZ24850.1 hypothetical protein HJG54_19685 [Leptolyngbya sp. NK1-12]
MIELIAASIGILTGVTTVLTTLSKLQCVLARLEIRDLELKEEIRKLQLQFDHATDQMELLTNGLKERIEHVNTRLSGQVKETGATIYAIEAFLQKNTTYERRGPA